jgi:hypothetical protein
LTTGKCVMCPFMEMNNFDALQDIIADMMASKNITGTLASHLLLDHLQGRRINGQGATDLGMEAILYMRQFMQLLKELPIHLVQKIIAARR